MKIHINGTMDDLYKYLENSFLSYDDEMFDNKLTLLRDGLKNYYETYSCFGENHQDYLSITPNGIITTHVRGTLFFLAYSRSIISIHLFFEHLLKDLVKTHENIEWVQYANLINKFVKLTQQDNKIDNKYHFLTGDKDVLLHIAYLRNNIVHKGDKAPNRYHYEVLFINYILPIIRKLLSIMDNDSKCERNLHCGYNVIDELIKQKLPLEYNNTEIINELKRLLRRISHFKELGRASFSNEIYMGENPHFSFEEIEKYHNAPIKRESQAIAKARIDSLKDYKIYTCPCCGLDTLTTFDYWKTVTGNRTRVHKARCVQCSYAIHKSIGEPKDFKIMQDELFGYID